jgi:Cytidine and deoxycytidylate deaminase zinc-binding region
VVLVNICSVVILINVLMGNNGEQIGGAVDMDPSREATDRAMMSRCIELSRIAVSEGEYPFGTVIALDGRVVAEAINRNIRDGDVTRHAEVIALSRMQKAISRTVSAPSRSAPSGALHRTRR